MSRKVKFTVCTIYTNTNTNTHTHNTKNTQTVVKMANNLSITLEKDYLRQTSINCRQRLKMNREVDRYTGERQNRSSERAW